MGRRYTEAGSYSSEKSTTELANARLKIFRCYKNSILRVQDSILSEIFLFFFGNLSKKRSVVLEQLQSTCPEEQIKSIWKVSQFTQPEL